MADESELQYVKMMTLLAGACNIELKRQDFELHDRMLSKYGYPALISALENIVVSRKPGDRFPSIAEIKQIVDPKPQDHIEAIDIANQIIAFMKNAGARGDWYQGQKYDGAKQAVISTLGELAWTVMARRGGYGVLYAEFKDLQNSQLTFFRTQLRDSVMAVIEKSKAGKLDMPTALPSPAIKQEQGGSDLKQITNQILDKHRGGCQ